MGILRSAAARIVSPARTPSPPLYVGMPTSRPISMEKYAMVLLVSTWFSYLHRRLLPMPPEQAGRPPARPSPGHGPCTAPQWHGRSPTSFLAEALPAVQVGVQPSSPTSAYASRSSAPSCPTSVVASRRPSCHRLARRSSPYLHPSCPTACSSCRPFVPSSRPSVSSARASWGQRGSAPPCA